MIAEAFLICAMSLPPSAHMGHHRLTADDGAFFRILTQFHGGSKRPPILFAYNYFQMADTLRAAGIRAYSMTIALSGGHVKGIIEELPFQDGTLAAVIAMQPISLFGLREIIPGISPGGSFLIDERHLPGGGALMLRAMRFKKRAVSWHMHSIWTREPERHLRLLRTSA